MLLQRVTHVVSLLPKPQLQVALRRQPHLQNLFAARKYCWCG
jgi:hypothetical protein